METLETPPRIAVTYSKDFNPCLDVYYQRKRKWKKEEIELDESFGSILCLETVEDGIVFLFYSRKSDTSGTMGIPKLENFPKVCHLSFDVDRHGRIGGSMKV